MFIKVKRRPVNNCWFFSIDFIKHTTLPWQCIPIASICKLRALVMFHALYIPTCQFLPTKESDGSGGWRRRHVRINTSLNHNCSENIAYMDETHLI
jgi:hypothetical protein